MTLYSHRDAYLRQLGARSRHTPVSYGTGLARFCQFVERRFGIGANAPAQALKAEHVTAFARALRRARSPLAPASRRNYVLAVHRFYRYLVRERVLRLDAVEFESLGDALRIPDYGLCNTDYGTRQTLPTATPQQVDALIVAARVAEDDLPPRAPEGDKRRAHLRQLRNEALIRLLHSTGMRVGEALALSCGDLDAAQHSARVAAIDGEARTVLLPDKAWAGLMAYLGARGCADVGAWEANAGEPVFVRHDRGAGRRLQRLTRQRVEQLFAEWRDLGGIEGHVTPHALRQRMKAEG